MFLRIKKSQEIQRICNYFLLSTGDMRPRSAHTNLMEKEFAAEVICKFHKSGKIIPIKFRILDKTGREFKILSYTECYRHLEYRQGYMSDYQLHSQIDYACRIMDAGRERTAMLRYYIGEMYWTVKLI